ncbi:unnamed protein product [Boreogadus saida]
MLRLELDIWPLGVKNPEPLDHDVSFNGYLSALQIGPRVSSSLLYINNDNHSLRPLEPSKGVEGMECSLPMDGRRVSLTQLSNDSFRECQATLTLTDLLIIIFSGISVSVVAIMTSFFLASTVHCFQRWSKGSKGDEEESEE